MSMKKIVLTMLMTACLPFLTMAQSNDDLYFIPKKKTEKVTAGTPAKVVVEKDRTPVAVYPAPASTVVVKDVKGNVRDVDEYNRRYTSRDNTFTMENDTLYIEEKPYDERGEWVNGFEGSQSDYEYAMRIVRFRNPRFAIPVSSPLYWDIVYALPSWEWNVYDDGFYAYAFPTYSNSLWWDWRFNYSWSWGWRPFGYYNAWHPHHWYHNHWYAYHPHHLHHPHFAWGGVGGYWGGGHGKYGSSAQRPGIHAGRYSHNYQGSASSASAGRNNQVAGTRQRTGRNQATVRQSSGRVVTAKDGSSSVRPQRSAVRTGRGQTVNRTETSGTRSNTVYTRPSQGRGSSYDRESSTRSTVNHSGTSATQRRSAASERGGYRSQSSSGSSSSRSSYNSGSSRSSSQSSFSSGSSSSSRSSASGSSSRSGGGSGRSGGGRR